MFKRQFVRKTFKTCMTFSEDNITITYNHSSLYCTVKKYEWYIPALKRVRWNLFFFLSVFVLFTASKGYHIKVIVDYEYFLYNEILSKVLYMW